MADEATLQNSLDPQQTEFEFSSKQYTYLNDQNNGSYANGQIVFDCAGLANSGKFVDWSQSTILVPIVLNVNLDTACAGSVENVFAASLKNGYHNLINSLSVEIANNSVVNLTNFSNIKINYDLLTTCSREDELNFLPSINFAKDNAESISYQPNASASGYGECNNIIAPTVFNPTSGWGKTSYTQNQGRLQRMLNTSFDPAVNAAVKNYTSTTATQLSLKNYATQSTTSMVFYITATIPLKIVHDLFKKLPLTKGMYARIIVNTNCNCSASLTTSASGITYVSATSSTQNGVLPFMISPATQGQGFAPATTGATVVTATMGIAKVGAFSHQITTSRLYCATYEMSPIYEERYFQAVPIKKILYNDILQFMTSGIAPQGQVNQILTNGISRARALLVVPMLSAQTNGTKDIQTNTFSAGTNVTGTQTFSPMASPFSSAPGTCCPFASVSNFNVLVSGTALYQSNIQYKFEHFLQEVRPSNSINGGLSLAMSSGLLSQTDYENGYGYIYVDLSRKTGQASDDVSRSVQLQLTNTSNCYVDYITFIIYEREITISTSTGALVI